MSDLAEEMILDLLRSSWILERARTGVYQTWARHHARFERSATRASRRAELVAEALVERGRDPERDEALVEPHAGWMLSLVGEDPDDTPLAELFLPRLGDWVDGHTSTFLGNRAAVLTALGDEERSELKLPDEFPVPPPYEPLTAPELEPPGESIFRFGILADLHFGSAHGEIMARAAIADLNNSDVDLVIQLGDITDHGDRDEFDLATKALAELEVPVTTMMGNHDVYSLKEERISGREYYSSSFERDPDGVLIEHKGWRFAVLDSVEHAASPFAPFDLVSGSFLEGSGGAVVRGSLSVPQHDLLAEVAEPGAPPAFVFLHHPPQPFTGFPPVLFGLRDVDSGRLHATVDSGNVWGVFAGHTHRNARTTDYGTVPAHEVAIPRDYPFGYALVDVGTEGYAYRFVQLSDEDLLREAYQRSGTIHRRYGRGSEAERAFTWARPALPG